jgi:uncharacterized membrane protein YdjX (TVP38/TMEM64 family)
MIEMSMNVERQPLALFWRLMLWVRRREVWLLLAVAVVVGTLSWILTEPLIQLLGRAEEARIWILEFGVLAPLVYISLFAAQILLAPLPGQFMGVMGGYLFGVLWGSLYSIVGLVLGAGLAIVIARCFGRPLLERFVDKAELHRWERKFSVRSPVTWWLIFLFPVPDLAFYVAGLTSIPIASLLLAVISGRGIGLIFANLLGHWTAHLPAQWVIVKWAVLAVIGVLAYLYQRRIRLTILLTTRRARRRMRRYRTPVGDSVAR